MTDAPADGSFVAKLKQEVSNAPPDSPTTMTTGEAGTSSPTTNASATVVSMVDAEAAEAVEVGGAAEVAETETESRPEAELGVQAETVASAAMAAEKDDREEVGAAASMPPAAAEVASADAEVLSQERMVELFVEKIIQENAVFYKCPMVHARVATVAGKLTTVVGGDIETTNIVQVGDVIVANPAGEQYAMSMENFKLRYAFDNPLPSDSDLLAAEGFQRYTPLGKIWAHLVTKEEMDIYFTAGSFIAAWGEPMLVRQGDMLAVPNPGGNEIYRIDKVAFDETYETEAKREEKVRQLQASAKKGPTPPAGLPTRREPIE